MNKAQRSKIKINGLQAQNTKLHEICTQQREAITKLSGQNRELGIAVDSILAAVAKKYGEKVISPYLIFLFYYYLIDNNNLYLLYHRRE